MPTLDKYIKALLPKKTMPELRAYFEAEAVLPGVPGEWDIGQRPGPGLEPVEWHRFDTQVKASSMFADLSDRQISEIVRQGSNCTAPANVRYAVRKVNDENRMDKNVRRGIIGDYPVQVRDRSIAAYDALEPTARAEREEEEIDVIDRRQQQLPSTMGVTLEARNLRPPAPPVGFNAAAACWSLLEDVSIGESD